MLMKNSIEKLMGKMFSKKSLNQERYRSQTNTKIKMVDQTQSKNGWPMRITSNDQLVDQQKPQLGKKQEPEVVNIKLSDDQLVTINIASLNYGFCDSPFHMFSHSSFQDQEILIRIFNLIYNKQLGNVQTIFQRKSSDDMKNTRQKWDAKYRNFRYSPLYYKDVGLDRNKFLVNKQQFKRQWKKHLRVAIKKNIFKTQTQKNKSQNPDPYNRLEVQDKAGLDDLWKFDWSCYCLFLLYAYKIQQKQQQQNNIDFKDCSVQKLEDEIQNIIYNNNSKKYKEFLFKQFDVQYLSENSKSTKLLNALEQHKIDIFFLQNIRQSTINFIEKKTKNYRIAKFHKNSSAILISWEAMSKIWPHGQIRPLPYYNQLHFSYSSTFEPRSSKLKHVQTGEYSHFDNDTRTIIQHQQETRSKIFTPTKTIGQKQEQSPQLSISKTKNSYQIKLQPIHRSQPKQEQIYQEQTEYGGYPSSPNQLLRHEKIQIQQERQKYSQNNLYLSKFSISHEYKSDEQNSQIDSEKQQEVKLAKLKLLNQIKRKKIQKLKNPNAQVELVQNRHQPIQQLISKQYQKKMKRAVQDTLKKHRNQILSQQLLELIKQLPDTYIQFFDRVIFISSSISFYREQNYEEKIQKLLSGLYKQFQGHYEIIMAIDTTKQIKPEPPNKFYKYPNKDALSQEVYKVQSFLNIFHPNKSIKHDEIDDSFISTMQLQQGQILDINNNDIKQISLSNQINSKLNKVKMIPNNDHPFDHYLIRAKVQYRRLKFQSKSMKGQSLIYAMKQDKNNKKKKIKTE